MMDLNLLLTILSLFGSLFGCFITFLATFWQPEESSARKEWRKKWQKIIKRLGLFLIILGVCTAFYFFLEDALVPPEVSIYYEDTVAKVELVDGPKWAAQVCYSVDEADAVRWEKPFENPLLIYENTVVTAYTKIWFIPIGSVSETIDMLPVYHMSAEDSNIFTLKITAPQEKTDFSKLEVALSLPENGYIDFTQMDNITANGIGGAQFIVTGTGDTQFSKCFNRAEQYTFSGTDPIPAEKNPTADQSSVQEASDPAVFPSVNDSPLADFSSGGYLTMRMPLDEGSINFIDIVVNKSDLRDLLQRNSNITITAYYSEQTLSVSVRTGAGAACRLPQGLLLELHGPGHQTSHLIGSYAAWSDGTIIQKSVARNQGASSLKGNINPPNGQNPSFNGQAVPPLPPMDPPPENSPVPPNLPEERQRSAPCSLLIPVNPFDGSAELRIVDELKDNNKEGSTFKDVSDLDFDAAAYASGHGLLVGFDVQTFAPSDTIQYGEVLTILFRLEGCPDTSGDKHYGLPKSWFKEAEQWALNTGIVTKDEATQFHRTPKQKQVQYLRMLWRLVYSGTSDNAVSDADIQTWAIKSGFISEDASNPKGEVSRIQFARIIRNYCIANADWKKAI